MNQTEPLRIMALTASPPTCAARGSDRATREAIVVLPAPGIPVRITQPDTASPPTAGACQQRAGRAINLTHRNVLPLAQARPGSVLLDKDLEVHVVPFDPSRERRVQRLAPVPGRG